MKALLLLLGIIALPALAVEPIHSLQAIPVNPEKAKLGALLFVDTRLSGNNSISCASCHQLNKFGVDNVKKSVGIAGKPLKRNTPTILNSGHNFTQMWDGRMASLETRVNKAVTSPALMGMESWDAAVAKIAAIDHYQNTFKQVYGGVSAENIQHAIAEFQRSQVLLDAPFDRFLSGDKTAISPQAQEGYALFKEYGCISCHQGANVGGNMYQKMGALNPIDLAKWNNDDVGRFALTNKAWDKHVFKVPSLRLVVHTAPYFHDGSAKTLKEAINKMAHYQLDRPLPETDISAIIAFLETLPGTRPALNLNNELANAAALTQPLAQGEPQ